MSSIIDVFESRVKEYPSKLLFAFLNIKGEVKEEYTYLDFNERTKNLANNLSQTKIKKGDRVLLVYPPGLEIICAFFACTRLGFIPVPVYPPSEQGFDASIKKMGFIAKDCSAVAILTIRSFYWSIKVNLERESAESRHFTSLLDLLWVSTDEFSNSTKRQYKEAHSEILFLQYTSGSTNEPKGVMVTHTNLLDNFNNVVDHLPIGVSWLPQYHDMGFIGYYIFFAIKGGTTYGFSPKDFILRPSLWLETISKYKGSASSAPNFAYEYCLSPGKISDETMASLDLSSLRFLMNAAEPINAKIFSQFIEKFKTCGLNSKSCFAAYGLAENTLAVSNYGRVAKYFDAELLKKHLVKEELDYTKKGTAQIMSCGKVLGDTKIEIVSVDSPFKSLNAGHVGEIWVTGTSKCKGYWNKIELSKEKFEAEIDQDKSGTQWLRTGDLGFVLEGELFVSGRIKDMLIIRGLNYYPHDIEALVEEDTTVRKGCVAAFSDSTTGGDELIILVGIRNLKKSPNLVDITSKLIKFFGISAKEIICVPARTIAKTSSGKIMRFENKRRYLNNELQIIDQHFSHNVEEIDSELKKKNAGTPIAGNLQSVLNYYGLTGNETCTLTDAGLDSIKLAEFAYDIKGTLKAYGFADLTDDVDIQILQKIAVSELVELLNDLRNSTSLSRFRFKSAMAKMKKELRKNELKLMQLDAKSHISKHLNYPAIDSSKGGIFLTGATGFFGPFLLKSLVEQSLHMIYVLVRSNTPLEAMNRIKNSFSNIELSDFLLKRIDQHVIPICGDLEKPKFGLSSDAYNELAEKVNTIYHNAALVNYLLDYESMKHINVDGTHEVIHLATYKRPKVINYISTTFIFGWSVKDVLYESDCNTKMELLDFGYSQSKWVADQVVLDAMSKGLNARIFRPALISPSIQGEGYNFDISIRLLAFMVNHGIGTTAQNQVSFSPADTAAHNIVAISNLPESIGKTFHVTRDNFSSLQDVTDILSEITGKKFKLFALKSFVPEVVSKCTKEDILFPLLNFLVGSVDNISSMEFKRYDNSNYTKYRDLSPIGIQDESFQDVVEGIYKFIKKHQLINGKQSNYK
jgi:thioester reductase-like protein